MKRLMLCIVLLISVDLFGQTTDNEKTKTGKDAHRTAAGFGVKFEARYDLLCANPGPVTFTNIPASLRTVPTHKDDGWFGTPGSPRIIPDADFTTKNPAFHGSFALGVAPQYTIGRFTFRGGAMIGFPRSAQREQGPIAGDFDSYSAVNQYGKPVRGTGTSLVYYSLYWQSPGGIKVNPYGEVELRLQRFVSVLAGYNPARNKIFLWHELGYDRWNSLEVYLKSHIATLTTETSHYFGARFGNPHIGFTAGAGPVAQYVANLSAYPGMSVDLPAEKRMGVFISMDIRLTGTK